MVHFSLDAWTSPNGLPFVAVIAHFVEKSGRLREELVDFFEFPGSHTGQRTAEALFELFKELDVVKKVSPSLSRTAPIINH